ncbi:MAG: hypothetical protein BroJett040_16650 [Oligoflexia bacterium]|nr:MAG: hypothetical protein BroJett040_16650 [Oligoflexia bacterium]
MKISLLPNGMWEGLQDQLRSHLSIDERCGVYPYQSHYQGLSEVSLSIAQVMSHKRNLGFVSGSSPLLPPILSHFSKDSYGIQSSAWSELNTEEKMKTWVEALPKDTAMVFLAEDHPITGEIYPWQALDKTLNEKKIFSVRLSHSLWCRSQPELGPFSVCICDVQSDFSLALTGSRVRVSGLMAPHQDWQKKEYLKIFTDRQKQFQEKKDLVLQAEKNLIKEFKPFLQTSDRIYDRALFYSEKIHGQYFAELLKSELNLSDSNIGTTNLCAWGGVNVYEKWWNPCPNSEILRGLVYVDVETLSRPEYEKSFLKVADQCLKSFRQN